MTAMAKVETPSVDRAPLRVEGQVGGSKLGPKLHKPGARARRTWITRGIWAAIIAAGVGTLAYAWRPQPIQTDLTKVTRGDLIVTVEEVAKSRVRDRYVVAAPLAGNLLRVELKPGDSVQGGAVLARITPMESPLLDPRSRSEAASRSAATLAAERQSRAAVARAEIASQHAEEDLTKDRKLVESGSIPPESLTRASLESRLRTEELASARFAAQMATHEAAMARAALARFDATRSVDGFDVPSPTTGSVFRVLTQNAGPVQAGTPLVEIGDPSALEIVTDVLSTDAVRIHPGAKTTLERWGGAADLKAHVRRVEPSGFTRLSALGVEEQRVPVVIDLDEPRERWTALGDGFRVEVRIVVDERRGVLRAPLGAIFRHGDGWATYTVNDKGKVELALLTLGARNDVDVEIVRGVPEGATVVVHPGERVKEGEKVVSRK